MPSTKPIPLPKLKALFLGTLMSFALFTAEAHAVSATLPCEDLLADKIKNFREEMRALQERLDKNKPGWVPVSQRALFMEAESLVPTATQANGAIISLGSDLDFVRPLADFPLAQEIHLVDHFHNQLIEPSTPQDRVAFLEKVLAALRQIAPDAQAELENSNGIMLLLLAEPLAPAVRIRVKWTSPSVGSVEKTIVLHRCDYNGAGCLESVEASLGNLPIAGLVMTGLGDRVHAPLPKLASLQGRGEAQHPQLHSLLKRVRADAAPIVLEYFTGAMKDEAVLNALRPPRKVTAAWPTLFTWNAVSVDPNADRYLPRLYVLQPTAEALPH